MADSSVETMDAGTIAEASATAERHLWAHVRRLLRIAEQACDGAELVEEDAAFTTTCSSFGSLQIRFRSFRPKVPEFAYLELARRSASEGAPFGVEVTVKRTDWIDVVLR